MESKNNAFGGAYDDTASWYAERAAVNLELHKTWGYKMPERTAKGLAELAEKYPHFQLADSSLQILEVGAGDGAVGLQLRSLGFPRPVGTDLVPEMLEQARKTEAYRELEVADLNALDALGSFDGGAFDVLLCIGTTSYLAHKELPSFDDTAEGERVPSVVVDPDRCEHVLRRWLRVLRPGGLMGFTVRKGIAPEWERQLAALEKRGAIRELLVTQPLDYLPNHEEQWVREETVRLYWYAKPMARF